MTIAGVTTLSVRTDSTGTYATVEVYRDRNRYSSRPVASDLPADLRVALKEWLEASA